ncbi:hypothetical protein CAEBREN_12702 [Caenorhabditis brenneri]|uniref:ShKT domain-containing protein n=1 Tax=Caenorhabditis brenneri TaxID=135651 RepID=G0N1V2_CAEBE|nr:hypothetical protein CAEBREN_12702 [Caenorhabditis brenneri]
MQSILYSFSVLLAAVIVTVDSQCTDLNANCPNWVANGFCTSTFYTDAKKTEYCPASCGLCSGVSSTGASASSVASSSATCIDTSANCATWASNGFCTSTFYTDAQKAQYCAQTCSLCGSQTTAGTATTSA